MSKKSADNKSGSRVPSDSKGSKEKSKTLPAKQASAPVGGKPAFEDLGELPSGYGSMFLIARDPHWLFSYWDFDYSKFPSQRQLLLHVYRGAELEKVIEINEIARNWYIPVDAADSEYRVAIGYNEKDGKWTEAGSAGPTRTPPESISGNWDTQFATVPFHLSFNLLMDVITAAHAGQIPLTEALGKLQSSPGGTSSWGVDQVSLLEALLGKDLLSRLASMSSGDLMEYLRHELHEGLSSESASELLAKGRLASLLAPAQSSLFSGSLARALSQELSSGGVSSFGQTKEAKIGGSSSEIGGSSSEIGGVSSGIGGASSETSSGLSGVGGVSSETSSGLSGVGGVSSETSSGLSGVGGLSSETSSGLSGVGGLSSETSSGLSALGGLSSETSSGLSALGGLSSETSSGLSGLGGLSSETSSGLFALGGLSSETSSGLSALGGLSSETSSGLFGLGALGGLSSETSSGLFSLGGLSSEQLGGIFSELSALWSGKFGESSEFGGESSSLSSLFSGSFLGASESLASWLGGSAFGSWLNELGSGGVSSFSFSSEQLLQLSGFSSWSGLEFGPSSWNELVAESSLFSAIGASWSAQPFSGPEREFFMHINAEVIFYGGTHPQAKVTIDGQPVQLQPDGTFRYHFKFTDHNFEIPIVAVSPDGVESRSAVLYFKRDTTRQGDVGATNQPAYLEEPMGRRTA